jgi:hypothetical protein
VPQQRFPCNAALLGFESYPYTIRSYAGGGHDRLIEFWTIHGLGHNYPNGDTRATFTDPFGPDVNEPAYDFFMANPMPSDEPVDTEPPTVTIAVDAGDAVASTGWYNAESSGTDGVTVHVSASDPSGVAGMSCSDGDEAVSVPAEGGALTLDDGEHSLTCEATDNASNTGAGPGSTPMPVDLDVDQTGPVTQITGVEDGASYPRGAVPAAACTTQDETSGADQAATVGVTGGNANGTGTYTARCGGATDIAGNQGTEAVAVYDVTYTGVSGFVAPLSEDGGVMVTPRNRALVAKFRVADDEPAGFDTSGWVMERIAVDCDTHTVDGQPEPVASTNGRSFDYDASGDQYLYHADLSSAPAGSCLRLRVTLDDGRDPTVFSSRVLRVIV